MTDGDCYLCGETYTKRGMSRHLRACLPDTNGETTLHLRIAGARRTDYWIHLAIEAETTLATLDGFLRRLWLECCSHLSAFTLGNTRYERPYSDDEPAIGLRTARRAMDVPIGSVADADAEFMLPATRPRDLNPQAGCRNGRIHFYHSSSTVET